MIRKIFKTNTIDLLHYLVITLAITVVMHFRGVHAFHTPDFFPNLNFLILFIVIFVVDKILHKYMKLK